MDPIIISPNDLWQVILAISAGITVLAGAGGVIAGIIHKAKEPNAKQNERLSALEDSVEKIKERLEDGNRRFQSDAEKMDALEVTMRDANKVILESLQALTAHAIDGNNTDKLKDAEKALHDYLLNKV